MEKNTINIEFIGTVLQNKDPVEELQGEEDILVLFYGRNYLHRVLPVTSEKNRILATLNYNLKKNRTLSENVRLTFFGRLH